MSVTISAPLASPPQQFSNIGTLLNQGTTPNAVSGVMLFLNGLLQVPTLDYTRNNSIVTMVVPPVAGDVLMARVFVVGLTLGGAEFRRVTDSSTSRNVAPWTCILQGPYDGIETVYEIVTGPSISGACDGINSLFTWQVTVQRPIIFRNGILQTEGVDVATAQTAVKFLPGAIPQPSDIITMLAYWQ